jgi:hypothetical protein
MFPVKYEHHPYEKLSYSFNRQWRHMALRAVADLTFSRQPAR